jgi:glycosyltransferase involved in cell wall biosynthesis
MTDNKPLISVIVPVYKVEQYLNECVDSVLAQTYDNIEVILVDDGSPDRCPQMCDDYAAAHANVRVVHKANGGLSSARNAGLAVATGEWIAFVDSDDWLVDANAYSEVMAHCDEADIIMYGYNRQQADASFVPCIEFDSVKHFSGDALKQVAVSFVHSFNECAAVDCRKMQMSVWSAVFKRSVIPASFYSEREVCSEDLPFKTAAVLQSKSICYVPRAVINYRFNDVSLTKTFSFEKFYRYATLTAKLTVIMQPYGLQKYADYCMIYATANVFQSMRLAKINGSEAKDYMHKIIDAPVWSKLTIDKNQLSTKERFLYNCIVRKRYAEMFIVYKLYAYLKR